MIGGIADHAHDFGAFHGGSGVPVERKSQGANIVMKLAPHYRELRLQ